MEEARETMNKEESDKVSIVRVLGAAVARDIFAYGSEPSRKGGLVHRIEFKAGEYPGNEIPLGGLCEEALAKWIAESLEKHLTR